MHSSSQDIFSFDVPTYVDLRGEGPIPSIFDRNIDASIDRACPRDNWFSYPHIQHEKSLNSFYSIAESRRTSHSRRPSTALYSDKVIMGPPQPSRPSMCRPSTSAIKTRPPQPPIDPPKKQPRPSAATLPLPPPKQPTIPPAAPTQWVPLLYPLRILKQWEAHTGKIWSKLSPQDKMKANEEIKLFLKTHPTRPSPN